MFRSIGFELRFAWRNLTRNLGRSAVVFFTMTIIAALAVAGFTIDDTFRQIFTMDERETYLDVDLVMTYDANSTTRIVNKRTLVEDYADRFVFIASFFNFYAGVDAGGETTYAQVHASSVAEMERVLARDLPSLSAGEAVVSRSFAELAGVAAGDVVGLYLDGVAEPFLVVEVVDDVGILRDGGILVEKTALLERIYGVSGLGNLGNTVYFALKPGVDVDETIAALSAEPEYESFVFTEVAEPTGIARMAAFNSSIFLGVGLMAIVALALVLRSVFPILFRDFAAQLGVVRTLGGSDRFAFRVWLWEFTILLILSFPPGILLAWYAFNVAGPIAGVAGTIFLDPFLTFAAIAAITVLVLVELTLNYGRLRRRSSVSLSGDRRAERESAALPLFIAGTTAFLLLRLTGWNASPWGRIGETGAVVVAVFQGSGLILKGIAALFRRASRQGAFGLFTIRHLASDRVAHNALKVTTMAIAVIAVTSMLNLFLVRATEDVGDQIRADYILANVFDYDPALKAEIAAAYDPESIDEAIFYTKTVLHTDEGEKRLRYALSIGLDALDDYFAFDIDADARERFADQSELRVLLPVSIGKVYGLQEGDEVTLGISKDLPAATAVVAGFIDTEFDSIALLNVIDVPALADAAPVNALFLNVADDGETAAAMIRAYASRMYFLIDVRETFAEIADLFFSVADYLTLIGWAVVFCFAVVILNNAVLVFDAVKADYARLITLGAERRTLYRLFAGEAAILATIAAVSALAIVVVFFPAMPEAMLLLDNYKVIPFDPARAALSIGAGILVFLIGYGTYFVKVRRMRIIDEIKRY